VGLRQFANSLQTIATNPHIDRKRAVARHFSWQVRKILRQFPFEQRISESRIIAAHRDCGVSALINSQGLYNYNNMSWLKELTARGGTFFDIGANIGAFTLVASEQHSCQVLAFEPHPETFRRLERNIELNGRTNARAFNLALSNQTGDAVLTEGADSSTNRVAAPGHAGVAIQCVRADQFCREHHVRPTLVKIDVEGFELEVLEGFGDMLGDVGVVLVEINGLSDARGAGSGRIHDLLVARGLRGPYQCEFDHRRLRQWTGNTAEDPLYVSEGFELGRDWLADAL
jgi:FkbM family methyltransferase